MPERAELERHALAAVRRYDMLLLRDPNVQGVGVGEKVVNGRGTGEPCVTVFVFRKLAAELVPESVRIPAVLDATGMHIPTDIVEAGPLYMHANTARIRPAQPGTSIGEVSITAGTLGAVVVDDVTGESLILSNNHVLANNNQAPIGSPILQPGPADGGVNPADAIAVLLRYVPVTTAGNNYVDAAVARPSSPTLLQNTPLNGVPAPNAATPAAGLIFGGDGVSVSLMNPIQTVLTMLGVSLPPSGAVINATRGMVLQKTGRTTERTIGTVQTTGTTVQVGTSIGTLTFVNQITTTLMSQGGDSGSLAVLNV